MQFSSHRTQCVEFRSTINGKRHSDAIDKYVIAQQMQFIYVGGMHALMVYGSYFERSQVCAYIYI